MSKLLVVLTKLKKHQLYQHMIPKPRTHVASMQEVKHLSHKRSRAANRLKYPATAPFDDVADYFSRCTTILYSNDSRELTGDSFKPCALALSTEKEMKFVDGVALR